MFHTKIMNSWPMKRQTIGNSKHEARKFELMQNQRPRVPGVRYCLVLLVMEWCFLKKLLPHWLKHLWTNWMLAWHYSVLRAKRWLNVVSNIHGAVDWWRRRMNKVKMLTTTKRESNGIVYKSRKGARYEIVGNKSSGCHWSIFVTSE